MFWCYFPKMFMYLLAFFLPPCLKFGLFLFTFFSQTSILFLFFSPFPAIFPFKFSKGNFTVIHFVSLFCFLGSDYIIIVIITIINIIDISDTQLL